MPADAGASAHDGTTPRAVLFDWDNTLIDNWASIQDALNTTLTAMGRAPWSRAEVLARVRTSARDGFPDLFGDRSDEATRIFFRRLEQVHLETLTELPGATALLEHLAARSVYLGVVSNKHGTFLRKEAAQLGWGHFFSKLIGANDAAADKPSPAPIHLALKGSGIKAGPDVWYVGDALIDIECARNAGCVAVLVGDGHGSETANANPDIRAPDLTALAKLIPTP